MQTQAHQETCLSVWKKLMDFRISQDAARQSRLRSFLTVEAYIMFGFAFAVAKAFDFRTVLPEITFLTLATVLCLMGLMLAWQSLSAHSRGAFTLRQLSRDIQNAERQLKDSEHVEISVFAAQGNAPLSHEGATAAQRSPPIKLTYIRQTRQRPVLLKRAPRRASNVVKSPDRFVMWATAIAWTLAFIGMIGVSAVTLSPSLQMAMDKAAQHTSLAS